MGYVGKVWLQIVISSVVCMSLSFIFKMHWSWIVVHSICLVLCLRSIISVMIHIKYEQKKAQKLYEIMTALIVTYRQSRHLIEAAQVLENSYDINCGNPDRGDVQFELLRAHHSHYLWQSIVNLVEIDVVHGDPGCVDQLYELEEEVDMWYLSVYHFTLERDRHIQTLSILVVFSLFVAWMVMTMLHSVLPLYLTQAYQLVVGVFILCLQLFIRFIFKQHRMPIILEVECVC